MSVRIWLKRRLNRSEISRLATKLEGRAEAALVHFQISLQVSEDADQSTWPGNARRVELEACLPRPLG